MFFARIVKTKYGWLPLAASEKGLYRVWLPKATRSLAEAILDRNFSQGELVFDDDGTLGYADALAGYFQGRVKSLDPPLDYGGATDFQKKVWEATRRIPYGQTRAYAWVAAMAGWPGAARGVGGAMAKNPLPLVVPCHRVIQSDGSLGGFGSGLEWKQRLLDLEKNYGDDVPSC